jgi:hypothetical protein
MKSTSSTGSSERAEAVRRSRHPTADLTLATGAKKFGAARFRALERRWESEGLPLLVGAVHDASDQLQRGEGRVEFVEVSRQYLQLTPLVGTA